MHQARPDTWAKLASRRYFSRSESTTGEMCSCVAFAVDQARLDGCIPRRQPRMPCAQRIVTLRVSPVATLPAASTAHSR